MEKWSARRRAAAELASSVAFVLGDSVDAGVYLQPGMSMNSGLWLGSRSCMQGEGRGQTGRVEGMNRESAGLEQGEDMA